MCRLQSILHGALTSPDCAPVAALISAWSAARRQEAARGVEAALQDEKSERRRSSDVSATRLSSSSAAGLPPQSQLVPDSARRVSGSSPRCPPVDSHADGSARNKPAPLSTVSGVSEHSLEDPSGASLEEAAAAGAAEAVGGFGVVPHPDLSLPSARRFSSRLLAVWKRSRLRTVTEKRVGKHTGESAAAVGLLKSSTRAYRGAAIRKDSPHVSASCRCFVWNLHLYLTLLRRQSSGVVWRACRRNVVSSLSWF